MTSKKYYQEHRDEMNEKSKEWYRNNKERRQAYERGRRGHQTEYMKEYRRRNPHALIMTHRKWKYGITQQDFSDMWTKQDGKCAICRAEMTVNKACVDHCHQSNRVRGLLCNDCNLILGHAKDDLNILKKAIEYLDG